MAKQVQLRRGTTAEHAAFTGVEGELTIDTTKDTIVVHDAYQVGGFPLLREDLNNLANNSVGAAKIAYGSGIAGAPLRVNTAGNATEFSYRPGEIIECLGMWCDGSSRTGLMGTITSQNVTAAHSLTTSYADLTGSVISYQPPAGTKCVRYRFIAHRDAETNGGIDHYKFYLNGNEVDQWYKCISTGYDSSEHSNHTHTFEYFIDTTAGTTTYTNGKVALADWTSAWEMKVYAREYTSSYQARWHYNTWYDGGSATGSRLFHRPFIEISAIA